MTGVDVIGARRTIPLLMLALLGWPPAATAGDPQEHLGHGHRVLRVLHVERPPVLDGVLDEPEWEMADVAGGFIQREPHEGMPATEPTEVRILTDGQNLYVGVHCFDSDPSGITARELRRNNVSNDDVFSLVIDGFHDHRNGVFLRVSPLGNQADALITDEGNVNYNWDERWEVETRIHEQGWSAEIKIPFKALRFRASDEPLVFGIDFSRVVRRKNEFSYWSNYRRSFRFFQVSQAGHLVGLRDIQSGLRVRVKPYVNTRVVSRGVAPRATEWLGDVGLEDVKIPIASSLTMDLTVNPDFAQTEVDDQVVSFDRVPTFFPEKREFFLEGGGLFNFGLGGRAVRLYHSRRIGLSEDGRTVPILGGAKLTGRMGQRVTLGLLNMQTGDAGGHDNFSVLRLKRDILGRSSVGVFLSNRQAPGGGFNRVVGWDQNLVLFRHLTVTGLVASSFTSGVEGAPRVWGAGWAWSGDLLTAGVDAYTVDENFRADVGFLSRVGVRKYGPHVQLSPRPRGGPIRQYSLSARLDHFRRLDGNRLETEVFQLQAPNVEFQDGSSIRFGPSRRAEFLDQPLRLAPGLVVSPGFYRWWSYPVTYEFNPARTVTGSLQYRHERDYFGPGGRRQTWNLSPTLRLNANLSTDIGYSLNRVELPGGVPVNVHVMNSRVNVAFSRRWTTSTLAQYSNSRNLVGINFRLRYNYRPGDDVYVVINGFRAGLDRPREVDRSVTLKFTRGFDF